MTGSSLPSCSWPPPCSSRRTRARAAPADGWSPRPATYPATVTRTDLAIPMSDGVVLRGDLELPADENGEPVDGRFPVIVTITAYNKSSGSFSGGLTGGSPSYLVRRGYAQLTVDARGTGSSEGQWAAFSRRENKDAGEVVEWAHSRKRPWSNGSVGMSGPSYLGISQIFAAGSRPTGLKAIFPQVPAADVYRDVVASGGQIDVGFIPLWLGLVTGTGVIPPAVTATDPESGFGAFVDHLTAAATFTIPLMLDALTGGEAAYDGTFYRDRSPNRVIDRVQVPTFLVGGEFDIFQRGTPLLFENLQRRGVPMKMIIGPWNHLEGSSAADIGEAGYGTLSELQLRWFDRYVRGIAGPDARLRHPADHLLRAGQWRLDPRRGVDGRPARRDLQALRLRDRRRRHRRADPGRGRRRPRDRAARAGVRAVHALDHPVDGRPAVDSARRTALLEDNALNDQSGVVSETEPLTVAAAPARPDQRAALHVLAERRRHALGVGLRRGARRHRHPAHRRLAGDLAPGARPVAQPLPRRQAHPAVPPVHAGGEGSRWPPARWRRSTSRSSRPPRSSLPGTGCGSRSRPSTYRTCCRRCRTSRPRWRR